MICTDERFAELARMAAARLQERGWRLASAESCTGGWLAKTATDLTGSSQWFERGFVTYSNEAKEELLGVNNATLAAYGAVSPETAGEMVTGALAHSRAQVALAITGIAGPSGGSPTKPVGLVWFAWVRRGEPPVVRSHRFDGDRDAVRRQAVATAWEGLLSLLA
jgi:nicotinamide-nucleotide amidase